MYETWHPHCDAPDRVRARINYTVWSDLFLCPHCGQEIVFWDVAVDRASGRVREEFPCPRCSALHTKRTLDRAWETVYDRALKAPVRRARQVPVLINYTLGRRRYEKTPDAADLDLLRRIEETDIPYPFPTDRMPEGDESRRNDDIGITHVHHFYTRRNLWTLAALWQRVRNNAKTTWITTGIDPICSRLLNFRVSGSGKPTPLRGTLYVSSLYPELNPQQMFFTLLSANLTKMHIMLPLGQKHIREKTGRGRWQQNKPSAC